MKYCEIHDRYGVCYKCRYANRKLADPVKQPYQTLKFNARRRNKKFELTLDEFRSFCVKTNYINKKGIFGESYHIDRIDENDGYNIENIQILRNSQNIRKYINYKYTDEDGRKIFKTERSRTGDFIESGDECPF